MNIPDINPQYKFRAVPRSNEMPDDPLYFTLEEAMWDSGSEKFRRLTDRKLYHHPDLFTGHTDKDGVEVYGRDVLHHVEGKIDCYYVVYFNGWEWVINDTDGYIAMSLYSLTAMKGQKRLPKSTLIGNIHNIEALPEEVKELLK